MNTQQDKGIERLTAAGVLLVAAIAAIISYLHIYRLAVTHGQPALAAVLLPVSVDGTVAVASFALLRAARAGNVSAPWLARVMLGLGVAATLGANAAYGAPFGPVGIALSGWPGIAFVGSVEIALSMVRRTRKRARTGPVTLPDVTVPGTVPAAEPVPATFAAKLEHAAHKYAAQIVSGNLPGVRQIKGDMGCGTPNAQKILAHLAELAGVAA
jgi:Protein of unknown function (DUF2637)